MRVRLREWYHFRQWYWSLEDADGIVIAESRMGFRAREEALADARRVHAAFAAAEFEEEEES